MSTVQTLFSSRAIDAVVFAALVVFTVMSLEMFGAWLERGADIARSRLVALALALVFAAAVIGGLVDYAFVGAPNFLNLALFLTGAAGLGILPALVFRRDRDKELRRIAALDL
ncbi:MAG TPA: hypothetical protein VMU22_16655 [Rhizomicrobium sp.]|nr:hypothetical protein [Rhizomicrobium sp.]